MGIVKILVVGAIESGENLLLMLQNVPNNSSNIYRIEKPP